MTSCETGFHILELSPPPPPPLFGTISFHVFDSLLDSEGIPRRASIWVPLPEVSNFHPPRLLASFPD